MPHLCGSIFWDNDEFKAATMLGLGVKQTTLFQRRTLLKNKNWAKCIEVNGDYIETIILKPSPILELNPEFYDFIKLPSYVS